MFRSTVGFTLIELMIVVAVVGILAMVAYPAYQQQVRESRRSEALIALTALGNDLDKFRSDCGSYPPDSPRPGNITGARSTCTGLGRSSVLSADGNYSLELRTANPPAPVGGYSITATAQGSQAGDNDCRTLTLTSTGVTSATAGSGGNTTRCWRR